MQHSEKTQMKLNCGNVTSDVNMNIQLAIHSQSQNLNSYYHNYRQITICMPIC